jgi:hypothetical protein
MSFALKSVLKNLKIRIQTISALDELQAIALKQGQGEEEGLQENLNENREADKQKNIFFAL